MIYATDKLSRIGYSINMVSKKQSKGDTKMAHNNDDQNALTEIDGLHTQLAKEHLGIDTLKTRGSDHLDFHTVSVWAVRSALVEAYECGGADAIDDDKLVAQETKPANTYSIDLKLTEIITIVAQLRGEAKNSDDQEIADELDALANQIKAVVTKKTELTARIDKLEDEIVALGAAKS